LASAGENAHATLKGERVTMDIRVSGSSAFQRKVEQDLLDIAATRTGKRLLRGLAETRHSVTIVPSPDGKNHSHPLNREDAYVDPDDGTLGPGTSATVEFNPDEKSLGPEPWEHRPPFVGLFHELIHAWDYTHGALAPGVTGRTKNDELSAVGLPFDDDGDPSTPEVMPDRVTENDLRLELGLALRDEYMPSRD
jgi:hypothetical protein